MSVFKRPVLALAALSVCGAVLAAGQVAAQAPATAKGAFTADQAAKGSATYADKCSGCHGQDFAGGPGVPPLKGPEFAFGWNTKSVGDLIKYAHDNMPPGAQGSLSDQDYTEIVAAILQANGFAPGGAALPTDAAAAGAIKIGQP